MWVKFFSRAHTKTMGIALLPLATSLLSLVYISFQSATVSFLGSAASTRGSILKTVACSFHFVPWAPSYFAWNYCSHVPFFLIHIGSFQAIFFSIWKLTWSYVLAPPFFVTFWCSLLLTWGFAFSCRLPTSFLFLSATPRRHTLLPLDMDCSF